MSAPLPETAVTPSAAKTCALRISGVRAHMPPVAPCWSRSRRVAFQASLSPVFWMSMLKLPHCARFKVAGPDFVTASTGPATMSIVGSLRAGVRGSSDGWSTMPVPLTKPWFEMTVPLTVLEFTTTLKVMVATLAWPLLDGSAGRNWQYGMLATIQQKKTGVLDESAGRKPGVELAGELIRMPFTSGDTPAISATAAPFSVVLPATYVVLAGTASRSIAF